MVLAWGLLATGACSFENSWQGQPSASNPIDVKTVGPVKDAAVFDGGGPAQHDGALTDGGRWPQTIQIGIDVANDVPESIYVQLNAEGGRPDWFRIYGQGARIWVTDPCGGEHCDGPAEPCDNTTPRVRNITGGDYFGAIHYTWDRMARVEPTGRACYVRQPLPPGEYGAELCYGFEVDLLDDEADVNKAAPGRLVDPLCRRLHFEMPQAESIVFRIIGG